MTIGENIRKYRTEKKISLSKLAAKAGMHPGSLTNIEKGYRNPSVDALSKIADALEVPLAALMQEDIDKFVMEEATKYETLDQLTKDKISMELIGHITKQGFYEK